MHRVPSLFAPFRIVAAESTRRGGVSPAPFASLNLGINTDADKFIAALEQHKPDILGMSALLTTTMPYMKVVIQTLRDRGIRDDYIVLVGGAPLNEEFGAAVGADAYCRDAGVAAETARRLIDERRASAA